MTHVPFGFKDVNPEEKNHLVQEVFSKVASGYDFMNDAMSLGLHRCWKQSFVNSLPLQATSKVIDVAGGTADIAYKITKKLQTLSSAITSAFHPVTVLDRNEAMLSYGRDKMVNKGALHLNWICGDAECLPVPSDSFDIYTISFGLRNVTHRAQALQEAHRVLKKGGVFACLEFSHSPYKNIDFFFRKFQSLVIPKLGQWLRDDKASYNYLVESIVRFPGAEALGHEIEQQGFKLASLRRFAQGGVALHLAVKV